MEKDDESPRGRLLAATSELFNRYGVQGVGVDRIVEEAGIAKATLYKHFPSKDDLILAWLRGPDARWLDWVMVEVDRRSDSPAERLTAIFDVLEEWFERETFQGCPFENTAAAVRDPQTEIRGEIRTFMGEVRSWLSGLLRDAGWEDHEELAAQIHLILAGTFWLAFAMSSPREAIGAARTATLGVLAGHRNEDT